MKSINLKFKFKFLNKCISNAIASQLIPRHSKQFLAIAHNGIPIGNPNIHCTNSYKCISK